MSLRNRIFLSYFALVVPLVMLGTLVVNRTVTESLENTFFESYDDDVANIVERITTLAEEMDDEASFDDPSIERAVRELATGADMHITLVAMNGWAFFDSTLGMVDYFAEDTYAEVRTLLLTEEAMREDYLNEDGTEAVATADFIYIDDEPAYVVRVARNWVPAWDNQQPRLLSTAAILLAVGLGVVGLFGGWLARALTRSLTELRRTAQKMAAGDLSSRANTQAPAEVAELAHDFNQMASAVESMMDEQKAFASNAAHELRTPLTAIRLRTETLLEDAPDAALTEQYIVEIDAEARRLSRLVDDLRVLSRHDSQRLAVGKEQVDVGRILRALGQEFAPQIAEKRLIYRVKIEDELPTLQASINHVQMVLRNLIENGVKYTPAGGHVWVSAENDVPSHSLRITISDSGIGIDPTDLPHLFKRFYRTDKSRNRAISGNGLGLSLSHALVSLYNGTLTIQSEGLGQGVSAELIWPLAVQ